MMVYSSPFGRGAARAKNAQGIPLQSHISPSIPEFLVALCQRMCKLGLANIEVLSFPRALPTGTKLESGTYESKRRTSVNLSNSETCSTIRIEKSNILDLPCPHENAKTPISKNGELLHDFFFNPLDPLLGKDSPVTRFEHLILVQTVFETLKFFKSDLSDGGPCIFEWASHLCSLITACPRVTSSFARRRTWKTGSWTLKNRR